MGLNIWAFNFQQAFGNEINFEAVIKIEGTEKPQLYAGGACSIVDQSSFAATYGLDDFFGNDLVTTQAPGKERFDLKMSFFATKDVLLRRRFPVLFLLPRFIFPGELIDFIAYL